MARNNREIDREQKQTAIVLVAYELFEKQGYDDTSMSTVAKMAGVAPNTLYWYFKNKDDLLIAVLNRMLAQGMEAYRAISSQTFTAQITWLFNLLEVSHGIMRAVHARAEQSEEVKQWHERIHQMIDGIVEYGLMQQGMSKDNAKTAATIGTFVIEGLLSHTHTQTQKENILRWLGHMAKASQIYT